MYIQSDLRNNYFEISKRDFLDDYANYEPKKIDMTMSGKYLYKYPKFSINYLEFSEYPTHKNVKELVDVIRKTQKIYDKEVIIGAGANGILQNIIKMLFIDGGNLVTPYLTFNQPEYAVTSMGGYTKRVYMDKDMQINISHIIRSIDKYTKMIYLCNPNNPTGILLSDEKIMKIATSTDKYIIIDESAIEFSTKRSFLYEEMPDNVIIIKSLSKAYGIANLRIGYMICSKEFKRIYEKKITVNEVSGISCQYAKEVLLNKNYKKNVNKILIERRRLEKELQKIGIEFYNSDSNTLFSKNELSNEFIIKLYENNVSVIKVEDQNKKIHIRIAVQDKKTNQLFINVCKKVFF